MQKGTEEKAFPATQSGDLLQETEICSCRAFALQMLGHKAREAAGCPWGEAAQGFRDLLHREVLPNCEVTRGAEWL